MPGGGTGMASSGDCAKGVDVVLACAAGAGGMPCSLRERPDLGLGFRLRHGCADDYRKFQGL